MSDREKKKWSDVIRRYFEDDRDLRLVVQLVDIRPPPSADDRVMIDRNESDAFRWVSLDELAAIPDFRDLAPRIETLLGEADAK